MSRRSFLFCLGIFIGVQLMALQSAAYDDNRMGAQQQDTRLSGQQQSDQSSSYSGTYVPPEQTPYSSQSRGSYDEQNPYNPQSPYDYPNYETNQNQQRGYDRGGDARQSAGQQSEYRSYSGSEYRGR